MEPGQTEIACYRCGQRHAAALPPSVKLIQQSPDYWLPLCERPGRRIGVLHPHGSPSLWLRPGEPAAPCYAAAIRCACGVSLLPCTVTDVGAGRRQTLTFPLGDWSTFSALDYVAVPLVLAQASTPWGEGNFPAQTAELHGLPLEERSIRAHLRVLRSWGGLGWTPDRSLVWVAPSKRAWISRLRSGAYGLGFLGAADGSTFQWIEGPVGDLVASVQEEQDFAAAAEWLVSYRKPTIVVGD